MLTFKNKIMDCWESEHMLAAIPCLDNTTQIQKICKRELDVPLYFHLPYSFCDGLEIMLYSNVEGREWMIGQTRLSCVC